MMRQQLWRSAQRPQALARLNAARNAFSTTIPRPAEVELTVDGKKVSIEGMSAGRADAGPRLKTDLSRTFH